MEGFATYRLQGRRILCEVSLRHRLLCHESSIMLVSRHGCNNRIFVHVNDVSVMIDDW